MMLKCIKSLLVLQLTIFSKEWMLISNQPPPNFKGYNASKACFIRLKNGKIIVFSSSIYARLGSIPCGKFTSQAWR